MTSHFPAHDRTQTQKYDRDSSVVFLKTKEAFGGLSNMAAGFPLQVNRIHIRTSEALYQACRFPHLPDLQRLIIEQRSPMTAKMKGKPYRGDSRPDWNHVRVKIMRWCLRVKLVQNWDSFSDLLLRTGDRPIVEQSRRDAFWGAKPLGERILVGTNVLGRLLMELRQSVKAELKARPLRVEPLPIKDFLLGGNPIKTVAAAELDRKAAAIESRAHSWQRHAVEPTYRQLPLAMVESPSWPDDWRSYAAGGSNGNLKPYVTYRDSGVPWLAEIPDHWQIFPGRACYQEKKQPNLGVQEKTVLSLSYGQIVVKPLEKLHGLVPASFETYQIVNPLDIVIRPTDLQNDWTSLRTGLSRHRGIITSAYLCFLTNERMLPEYGHLLLHSYDVMKVFYGLGSGLRQNLAWADFKDLPCLVPTLPEQTGIVRFLDHADRRIRRYLRAKEKLIALLEEQKQAIIHQAVTGRIDVRTGRPYPAYKDSGVEWLGKVPAYWEVARLKGYVANIVEQASQRRADEIYLALEHVESWTGRFREAGEDVSFDSQVKRFQAGDVLFGKLRPYLAKVTRPDRKGVCVGEFLVLRPRSSDVMPGYLEHLLRSKPIVDTINASTFGAKMPRADWQFIGGMEQPVPHLHEQVAIVNYLSRTTADIDAAVDRTRCQIELLRQYCTRLIADVVTGKLDVREASAQLPDQADDRDPMDENGPVEEK